MQWIHPPNNFYKYKIYIDKKKIKENIVLRWWVLVPTNS